MLSPIPAFAQSAELNDTGFAIELIKTPEFRTLLTADIGFNVEDWLVAHLTAEKLLEHSRLPLAWHDQRIALGFV